MIPHYANSTTTSEKVYGYGTIGHTSMHHAFLGGFAVGKPPVCDPAKRGGRIIQNPDPNKMCGRCEAIMFGLDPSTPMMSTLPPADRHRVIADVRHLAEYLTSCHDPAALHAWRCWQELAKPLGGRR